MRVSMPRILKDPARLALSGALVLLLAWSVDNLIRHRLDEAARVLSGAREAITDQAREADLRERFQAAQYSLATVQNLILTTHPRSFPIYNPGVLALISNQAALDRQSLELAVASDRASAAATTLNAKIVGTDIGRAFANLASRLRDLRATATELDSILGSVAKSLQASARAGHDYTSADENLVMTSLDAHEKAMTPIVYEAQTLVPVLDRMITSALSELQTKRNRLESWSKAIGWLYFLLFVSGTIFTILSKRESEAGA
jgi:hypothetical protein